MKINDIVNEKICVKCSTKKEYVLFLKAAEKAGMKWYSGNCPTQHYEYWENQPIYIKYEIKYKRDKARIGGLIRSSSRIDGYTVVKFSDLDLSDYYNEKYQLEIKQKNRSVIATLYDDKGAFVKYAKAKCSPEDKFDFETGKKIALQRLFEIEPEKEKDTCHKMVLKMDGWFYGYVGDPTEVEAYRHIKLFVGDVVELFSDGVSKGLCCVCKDSENPKGFVMNVAVVEFTNGFSVGGGWLIIKRKSYTEMVAGDVIDGVEYKLT